MQTDEYTGILVPNARLVQDDRFQYLTPAERAALLGRIAGLPLDKALTRGVRADIRYGALPEQRLDLYLPKGRGPFPLIIYIHGGGWTVGDKAGNYLSSCLGAVGEGFAVASVNYRLLPTGFPEDLFDCKTAIRWARANAARWGLDRQRIGLIGDSAGGYLAMMAALTAGRGEYEGAQYGWGWEPSHVQAVCSQFGPTDLLADDEMYLESGCRRMAPKTVPSLYDLVFGPGTEKLRPLFSPLALVTKNAPPILLQHGTADAMIPYQMSVRMFEKYNAVCGKGRAELTLREGWTHSDPRFLAPENTALVTAFFEKHLKG